MHFAVSSTANSSWFKQHQGDWRDIFGQDVTRNNGYREALIEASVVTNAALTAYTVQQEMHGRDPHDLRAVYGVYVLQSREVWAPPGNTGRTTGLAEPPKDPASFFGLVEAIVQI